MARMGGTIDKWLFTAVFLSTLLLFFPFYADARDYQFQKNRGIVVDVLSEDGFAAQFGGNGDIPQSDAGVITLAEELFIPLSEKQGYEEAMKECADEPEEGDWCGEYRYGLLFASLRNPAISDIVREKVDSRMEMAIPVFPEFYSEGHFNFWYTTNDADPRHNVTHAEIVSLAGHLNTWWRSYKNSFKVPKNVTGKNDVLVYYISDTTRGFTGSNHNQIHLNSMLAVKDRCKRRTTSAHELFHRVEYAYGYISGTANLKWIVEGGASWSQKFTNARVRDYMGRMHAGLSNPDRALITQRSYDAAHLWVYLQRVKGWTAIRDTWRQFQANGGDAKAALGTVVGGFDRFIRQWSKANYLKDTYRPGKKFSYAENSVRKTNCGVTYGPLRKVVQFTYSINKDTRLKGPQFVYAYGADYHVFKLANNMKRFEIDVEGNGIISYSFMAIKGKKLIRSKDINSLKHRYVKTFPPDTFDKIVLIVFGNDGGGMYTVAAGENWETFIDFGVTNGLGVGTAVTSQFRNHGVIFSGRGGGPAYIVNDYTSSTSPVLAGTSSRYLGPIEARFVHPVTMEPITVTKAGALNTGGYDKARSVRLSAFDKNGNLLESIVNHRTGHVPLVIKRLKGDIAKVRFKAISDEPWGFGIDHFVSTSLPLDTLSSPAAAPAGDQVLRQPVSLQGPGGRIKAAEVVIGYPGLRRLGP